MAENTDIMNIRKDWNSIPVVDGPLKGALVCTSMPPLPTYRMSFKEHNDMGECCTCYTNERPSINTPHIAEYKLVKAKEYFNLDMDIFTVQYVYVHVESRHWYG